MASGPYPDPRRGTWSVQWFDGSRWRRKVVVGRRPGWKPSDGMPKRPPREAIEALARYGKAEDEARRDRPRSPDRTIRAFLESYSEQYASHPETSRKELAKAVRSFLAYCDERGADRLARVDAAFCRGWIAWRAAQISKKTGRPISRRRLTQERGMLSPAWTRAVKRDELPANPWLATEIATPAERRRRGSWTPEQFAALVAACRPWLRDLLTLGTQTGLRINALCSLRWEHVELSPSGSPGGMGLLHVPPELDKAGLGYAVPLSGRAHDLLQRLMATRGDDGGPILRGAAGRKVVPNTAGLAIVRACRRAGLPKPDSPNHHMRRSFGRWAVMGSLTGRAVPLYVVSRWMGHTNVRTTQMYLELDESASVDWMRDVRGDQPGESRW